jgi:hypothetical protein
MNKRSPIIFALVVASMLAIAADAQSGGQFAIDLSVIATGGSTSSGGLFTVQGTVGQPAAGARVEGRPFRHTSGFWLPELLEPTAAYVSVSGRVTTQKGSGFAQTALTLTDSKGNVRQTVTNTFGYYRFDDVEAGATYILAVDLRKYRFNDSPRVIMVEDELSNVDFVASPTRSRSRL